MVHEIASARSTHVRQDSGALIITSLPLLHAVAKMLHASDAVQHIARTLMDAAAQASIRNILRRHR